MNPSQSKVSRVIDRGPPLLKGDFAAWQRDTLGHLHLECQTRWEMHAANADWDFMQRLHNLRERFFPSGSGRRFYFDKIRDHLVRLYDKMLIHREKKRTARRTLERGYPTWIREVEPGLLPPVPTQTQGVLHWVIAPGQGALRHTLSTLESIDQQAVPSWRAWVVVESHRILDLGVHAQDPRVQQVAVDPGTDWREAVWRRIREVSETPCDGLGILQAGDRLSPRATDLFLSALRGHVPPSVVFADEDELEPGKGHRHNPWFKPDFDPESFWETRSLGCAVVYPVLGMAGIGGWMDSREGSDPEQDLVWELISRGALVEHIHLVTHHRFGGVRHGDSRKMVASAQWQARKQARAIVASPGRFEGTCEVRPVVSGQPMVSVLIPNRDQPEMLKACIDSVLGADYPELEILIVENGSREAATHQLYRTLEKTGKVRVLPWTQPFNYSGVNNLAARESRGQLLLLMNNDVTTAAKDWIARMAEFATQPGIGAVGPMLLYPDGRVQHAGCVLGVEGTNGHRLRFADPEQRGYGDLLAVTREMTAVTGACLMVNREAFFEVEGMDEFLGLTFNDIDLCLKLIRSGKRNLFLPRVRLTHHECITRGHDITPQKRARLACEQEYFCKKWGPMAEWDRFHSPFLTSMHNILWLKPPVMGEWVHAAA